jgi:hypothetical protein
MKYESRCWRAATGIGSREKLIVRICWNASYIHPPRGTKNGWLAGLEGTLWMKAGDLGTNPNFSVLSYLPESTHTPKGEREVLYYICGTPCTIIVDQASLPFPRSIQSG